jgi:hypothetical protein
MRLWSLHPKYLDSRGLVALWREALLAQAVLKGHTKGYRNHPQLNRFRSRPLPVGSIGEYIRVVFAESQSRGFKFEQKKINRRRDQETGTVTRGQLEYEWAHLVEKVKGRDLVWSLRLDSVVRPLPHPLFRVIPGDIEEWEKVPGNVEF